MKIFIVPDEDAGHICVNSTDEENDAILIAQGARELTQEEIESAGMKGYEHLVCPLNTVVDDNGHVTFTPPPPPTAEELQYNFSQVIQSRLDALAQSRGYDNIVSVCSYKDSPNPKFKAEADRAILLRDTTWTKCYEILNDVVDGKREIPTLDEILSELPELTWD